MKFLLSVNACPTSPFSHAALNFAQAVLREHHSIIGVYFLGESVKTFNENSTDEAWLRFLKTHDVDSFCCSAAASTHASGTDSFPAPIRIAGLGQLIEMSLQADRTISFGSRSA